MIGRSNAVLLVACAILGSGCINTSAPYACFQSSQCISNDSQSGLCEPNGFCSFSDTSCASGRRFGRLAGTGLGDQCVVLTAPGDGPPNDGSDGPGGSDGPDAAPDGPPAPCVAAVSAGYRHTCVRRADGTVSCWGYNGFGQLGNGTLVSTAAPVRVAGLSGVAEVALGPVHTCARKTDGTVWCWGNNTLGELGNGTTTTQSTPTQVLNLTDAVELAASAFHACAREAGGTAVCWGQGAFGEMGDGNTASRSIPVSVSGLSTATQLVAGLNATCALRSDKTVVCWGYNVHGALGDGTTTLRATPVQVQNLTNVDRIYGDNGYGFCASVGSALYCWGRNDYGQVGDGTTTQRSIPVVVPGITNATDVAMGGHSTCAVLPAGSVSCWGSNEKGQVAQPGSPTSVFLNPTVVSGLANVSELSAGYYHVCARHPDSTFTCWGSDQFGQLGDGNTSGRSQPVQVASLAGASSFALGTRHSCALKTDGTVACWGANDRNQLGDGTTTDSTIPVAVTGLSNVTALAAGYYHTCAAKTNGTVVCWGYNATGQLGTGNTTSSATPTAVMGLSGATAIAAGDHHSCAITSGTPSVYCWGDNPNGEIGDGTTAGPRLMRTAVPGLSSVDRIGAGVGHTCAKKSDGSAAFCWGQNNFGQLGNGGNTTQSSPVAVSGLSGISELAVGHAHTCAIKASGLNVVCWGYNGHGELGDGSLTNRNTPSPTPAISNALQIALGQYHSCARKSDGTALCWGFGEWGQLGDGGALYTLSTTPVLVQAAFQPTSISAGALHTCATTSGGIGYCWGFNAHGQVGDGTRLGRPMPGSAPICP